MIRKIFCILVCLCLCASCTKKTEEIEIEEQVLPTPVATPPSLDDIVNFDIVDGPKTVIATNNWNAIAYGNGVYVAVGANGYVTISNDGKIWSEPKQEGKYTWNCIQFIDNIFLAAGDRSSIATSVDGVNWTITQIDIDARFNWSKITYGKHLIIVVGTDGYVSTSSDFVIWEKPIQFDSCHNLLAVTCGKDKFRNDIYVTVGNSGVIGVTTDGKSWMSVNKYNGYDVIKGIAYNNECFAAVGYTYSDGYIITSTDGVTWNNTLKNRGDNWFDIIYNKGIFIAIGYHYDTSYTGILTTSADGITWSSSVQIVAGNGEKVKKPMNGIVVVSE